MLFHTEQVWRKYGLEHILSKDDTYTQVEYYATTSAQSINAYDHWFQQLQLSINRIQKFEKATSPAQGIDFLYELENYYIRLNSIYDRLLQMVNAIFDIGLSPEHVRHSIIISNVKVTTYPQITKAIKDIRKLLTPYAQFRNTLIHKHSLKDQPLADIKNFSDLQLWNMVYEEDEELKAFTENNLASLRKIAHEKFIEFSDLHTKLHSKTYKLFSLFEHVYAEHINQKSTLKSPPPE
ncbi:MAG: hypothetical protein COA69_02470 [Robiginitomaculum sp.]|nr:MAG: hypothetical protein COA69_02470 [Robiginitomaculum sp.]